jgi:hypothetical protein
MSMIGRFREIPAVLLKKLKADPTLVRDIVGGGPPTVPLPTQKLGDSPELLGVVEKAMMDNREEWLKRLPPSHRAVLEKLPPDKLEEFFKTVVGLVAQAPIPMRGAVPLPNVKGSKPKRKLELGELVDVEKAWHGLHFLLSGSAEKTTPGAGQAVMGGTEIGPALGYGPARLLDPDEVRTVSAALSGMIRDSLRARYDAASMEAAKVYPGGWVQGGAEENCDWLLDAFETVQRFYASAASRGSAVLLYLT